MDSERLGWLEPVELRDLWMHEARDFTRWLAGDENLARLSAALGMHLVPEGVEVRVGPYKADIVARDVVTNTRVIIENQLGKTDHDHLGKTLTYASGLNARTIIWIAREFTEEHRQALDFLYQQATPNLRCFGITIELWRIDGSRPAPRFHIVCRPGGSVPLPPREKEVIGIVGGSAEGNSPPPARQEERSTPPRPSAYRSLPPVRQEQRNEPGGLYLDFWTGFKEYCERNRTFLPLRTPILHHSYGFALGRSNFVLGLNVWPRQTSISCDVYIHGHHNKTAFRLLEQQREAIERELGALEWREQPGRTAARIVHTRRNIDITDRGVWDEAYRWLKQEAEQFYKAFVPRVRALQLGD